MRDMFFTDKLRSFASLLLGTLILGAILASWAFPRHSDSTLDKQTLSTLKEVGEQVKRAADNLESQGKLTASLNTTLSQTLALQQSERGDAYKQLLGRYGTETIDIDSYPGGHQYNPGGPPPTPTVINIGVQSPDNRVRSDDIPSGAGAASRDRQLQKPAGSYENPADRGASPVSERKSASPS